MPRNTEVDTATAAFHVALTAIGVETLSDAIVLWDSVPAAQRSATAGGWLDDAVHLVMSRRSLSAQLARAYYRLVRALLTGKTVADPHTPEPQYVTLSKLRYEFAQLAGPRLPEEQRSTLNPGKPPGGAQRPTEGRERPSTGGDSDDRILVEEIAHLREMEEADARAAEEEARIDLASLGADNHERKLRLIDNDLPASKVDALRTDAHNQAGARQAATAARIVMNGGRGLIWRQSESDKRVIGYARISTTGTPCGWCAMLISRGPVYKSQRSATYKGGAASYVDGDKYHDNCHCVAIPVFDSEWFAQSPLFDLNREYEDLWPAVTRGLSGKAALSAWRRYIRQQQKTQAQEARAPRLAQEA